MNRLNVCYGRSRWRRRSSVDRQRHLGIGFSDGLLGPPLGLDARKASYSNSDYDPRFRQTQRQPLVILAKHQLSASDVYASPFSWQNTVSRRSRSCLALCALSALMARFGGRARQALRLGGLDVAGLDRGSPDVDHSPVELYMVPGALAPLARA
jgi:hypothetical protein